MNAKQSLKLLKEDEQHLYIIHYSCQNLNDNNENLSPRITSIAVLHLHSSTMHSFSIHLIAEIEKINRENIDGKYDELEQKMLEQFYKFVGAHDNSYWLHWNMSNINYGFEALEHRYKVLTQTDGKPIEDTKRFNLSELLVATYGKNCVAHPRMEGFRTLNDGNHRDILNGPEEVQAFQRKEYVKLHKSTMAKVYWFQKMYFLLQCNKVKVKNKNWAYKVHSFTEHLIMKLFGSVAILYAIYQLGSTLLTGKSE